MFETLKDAFVTAFRKPVTWAAVIGIPIIVGVFALLYVNTFIDPFERMKSVPVAVINEDAGATVDGEYKNFGDELVDSICDNDSAKWTVEDSSLIDDGLENSDYMIAIIIPSDFSEKVSAGETKEPEQANITFYKNVRKNYMFSTLSSRIESTLKETINNKISEQYISAYVEGLISAGDGMQTAADGAGELASGLSTAEDGTNTLADGMSQLETGASSLESGMSQLRSGASSLTSGMSQLQSGASSLVSGMNQLQSGSGSLESGMLQLQSGANSLISGMSQLQSGASSLQEGATNAKTGAASLAEGASQLSDGASQLAVQGTTLSNGSANAKDGISTLSAGIDTYATALTDKASAISSAYGGDPQTALAAAQAQYATALQQYTVNVVAAAQSGQDPSQVDSSAVSAAVQSIAQISSHAGTYQALTQASDGCASIQEGATELTESYATFDSGIQAYVSAANKLSNGAASVNSGAQALASGTSQIESGAVSLSSGIDSASSGASTLSSGIDSAASGATSLGSGIDSAASGASTLFSGITSAKDGTNTLADGITSATEGASTLQSSLADGAQTIDDSVTASSDDIAEYAANPVDTESDTFGDPGQFGYGFAPLFATLALWIGSLAAFFVFDPFPSSARLRRNRFTAVFARWPLYLVISALNAAVVAIGGLICGVPCADALTYTAMYAAIAFSFMCIMQLFNLFDVAGKALSVLLTVLQIVFCSGTFPAILGSDTAMAAGPWLPFYYAIDGLREAISGTNMQAAYCDAGMLLLFAAGATAISLLAYPAALKMKKKMEGYSAKALEAAAE